VRKVAKPMKNIRVEDVGDIHSKYNYLEVFYKDFPNPFLEIGITNEKRLSFKFYASNVNIFLNVEELEYILSTAKDFLPRALKNEDDFLKLY